MMISKMMSSLKGHALLSTVSAISCLGFLLIGYDNGLMGGLVNQDAFKYTFDDPGPGMIGLIVAIYEIGAFLGSIGNFFFGERLGRRKSIAAGTVTMIVGAILQAASFSRVQIIMARFVSGLGMGIVNSTVPVLQSEYSPKTTRGLYVCMQVSAINFGICLVYWIDFFFSASSTSFAWRIPVILQCGFLIPIIFFLTVIPETPRWLAFHGYHTESLSVLRRLHHDERTEEEISHIHQEILTASRNERALGGATWKDLIQNDEIQSRKRLIMACFIQGAQQAGGINAIVYYASTIFRQSVGLDAYTSSLISGFLQSWFFAASFIPWYLIDRVGRRLLLIPMVSLMAVVLAVQAALIYQVQNHTAFAYQAGIGASVMLFVFLGAFTVGFQATVWLYPCEILPLRLRQRGSALSTAMNWLINYGVVQLTPPAIANIGWMTYVIFAALNASFVPVFWMFFPETKGLELEDVDALFVRVSLAREGFEEAHEPLLRG